MIDNIINTAFSEMEQYIDEYCEKQLPDIGFTPDKINLVRSDMTHAIIMMRFKLWEADSKLKKLSE